MLTNDRLEALFEHLVLPPCILGSRSEAFLAHDLGQIVYDACNLVSGAGHPDVWEAIFTALRLTRTVHRTKAHKDSLTNALQQLGTTDQHHACAIIFESFQLVAPAAKVLEATHALAWDFPDRSVAISHNTFASESFIPTLSSFLEQSSNESFDRFAARANIGGQAVVETRDCPSPALITDMLMSLLEGLGGPVELQKQHRIRKKVRDDVVLHNSEVPWRRSPHWLLLRVFLQRFLSSTLSEEEVSAGVDKLYYKFIVAAVLAKLIELAVGQIHPAKITTLVAKLARRLAKLEVVRVASTGLQRAALDEFFSKTTSRFSEVMTAAKIRVLNAWEGFKRSVTRRIPPNIPRRSYQSEHSLYLTNSGHRLKSLLSVRTPQANEKASRQLPSIPEGTVAQIRTLAKRYTDLYDLETKLTDETQSTVLDQMSAQDRCCFLGKSIVKYLDRAITPYLEDSSLMSRCLLRVFELWIAMDKAAIESCPLLKDYNPVFVPEALDVLCLSSYGEMKRLRRVQEYLAKRFKRCHRAVGTIFSDATSVESFPAQFIKYMPEGKTISSLGEQIDQRSDAARQVKVAELRRLTDDYNRLTIEIEVETCTCTYLLDGTKNIDGCVRCFKWRSRSRLKIVVHEEHLPDAVVSKAQRSAILFELRLPEFFAVYREATWNLMLLGSNKIWPPQPEETKPRMTVKDVDGLQLFHAAGLCAGLKPLLTLASIKKSVLSTHYRARMLPVVESEIVIPFRPLFDYYDTKHEIWTKDMHDYVPGFEHLLGSWIPYPELIVNPYKNVRSLLRSDGTYPPSSYVIAASEPQCPLHLSAQEISAFQRAVSGRGRRWIVMLIELGATNINFSGEAAARLLSHLALQAGPAARQKGVLREAHIVFTDPKFCMRLHEQLSSRLSSISASWREVHYMSIIINFTLRLYQFGQMSSRSLALELLSQARDILTGWIIRLRQDVRTTQDPNVAQKAAIYAFHASLLCRRVFYGLLGSDNNDPDEVISEEDMRCFLRATIAMQEHLVVDIEKLTAVQKQLLRQDLYESYVLREKIKMLLIQGGMNSLQQVINETWSHAGSLQARTYATWTFCSEQDGWWLANEVSNTFVGTRTQVVHFHLLQGHLLIDGKPLGRLPLSMREDESIKELFGNQYLLTRPSSLHGMQYQLVHTIMDHEIHFSSTKGGQGGVIIQAIYRNCKLQHVKRDIFKNPIAKTVDLPLPLVDDCVHWINLQTSELEIRRKSDIWKRKKSHWVLDVLQRIATRHSGGSCLVEPKSSLGKRISSVFGGFEDPNRLTIFQSTKGPLRIEMKRLELSFYVNHRRHLQSDQLRCEVDPNQDAGTWYGLRSGIVVRDVSNYASRSILVPLGPLEYKRNGMHVAVHISNGGEYLRYSVDEVLGKLDCAPEPLILYLKAKLHALTSFHIPDPLTGRTGTEEAIRCLSSSAYQPWAPLNPSPQQTLLGLKSILAPRRKYYPTDKRLYQKVVWDDSLTPTIQHDSIGYLVERILVQVQQLSSVQPSGETVQSNGLRMSGVEEWCSEPEMDHLSFRGLIRRQLYERSCDAVDAMIPREALEPVPFHPSGGSVSKEANRVYSLVRSLKGTFNPHVSFKLKPLQQLLEGKSVIGAFTTTILNSTLNIPSVLDVNLSLFWGTLVETCRQGHPLIKFNICFALAIVAFGKNVDTDLVSWLAAIATSSQLQGLQPPSLSHNEPFREYKGAEIPNRELVESLLLHGQSIPAAQPPKVTAPARGKENRRRGGRQEAPHVTVTPKTTIQHEEASRLAYRLLTWISTATELSQDDVEYMAKEAGCTHLNLESAWTSLQPELRRVSDNTELRAYIAQLDSLVRYDKEGHKREPLSFNLKPKTLAQLAQKGTTQTFYCLPTVGELSLRKRIDTEEDTLAVSGACELTELTGRKQDMASLVALAKPQHLHVLDASRSSAAKISEEMTVLKHLVTELTTSSDATRKQYGDDLHRSLEAQARVELSLSTALAGSQGKVAMTKEQAAGVVRAALETLSVQTTAIQTALSAVESGHIWLKLGSLWPCVSHISLLELLRTDHFCRLDQRFKKEMIKYGLLITELQRLSRMQNAILYKQESKAVEEQRHEGHSNWEPISQPEWLLLEIDNNILIRPAQVDVARAIISPSSGSNSVLQMNMGQGKTSCIMPMAVTALADKRKLCRIVVPRALLQQTAQVMQSRLGGLIGRVVKHVPFSRRTPASKAVLVQYRQIHASCLETGGVMLCLPEHIMSFELSGFQRLADGQPEMAQIMMGLQDWLDNSCRDILDESDFTLSAKTQLIYPSGPQTAVDGHPHRWRLTQELLELVETHVTYLESNFPNGIHVVSRDQGCFPILYFLHSEVEDALRELLITDVCNQNLSLLELKQRTSLEEEESQKQDLRAVLVEDSPSAATWKKAGKHLVDPVFGQKNLFLLRGLISENVLLLCLKKRWNVHYGIHPSRPPIAVPFEAKGIPSHTAEYGHPDTAIILTCLAFYHTGLSLAQIEKSLKHVFQMADPAVGYEAWIQGCESLPGALRHWNLVNAEDVEQVSELWRHLRLDRGVVNHYLNTFVFPAHAKQFSLKLQASGWDIPLFVRDEESKKTKLSIKTKKNKRSAVSSSSTTDTATTDPEKNGYRDQTGAVTRADKPNPNTQLTANSQGIHKTTSTSGGCIPDAPVNDTPKSLTTGFSGTNDNKRMLPDTICQDDLPSLLQTNAEVLKCLLERRNRVCLQAADYNGRNLSERGLLELLYVKRIRVLIDSGAYILEMENDAVATAWLEIDYEAQGAVYFGKNNQIMVRAKFMKNPMPLLASPFADNLEQCVVYIDEAHTRGTDLKLPPKAQGALTLGLGQTKDHTVQGAMRLRQLGTTQSVTFVTPPEVYRSILDLQNQRGKDSMSMFKESVRARGHLIDSADVVRWLLEQSCKANDQMMSLHLTQGADFCRRTEAKWKHTKALTDRGQRAQLLEVIRQEEDQTLEQLYGPKTPILATETGPKAAWKTKSTKLQAVVSRIDEKRGTLPSNTRASGEGSAFQEVEQEREVEFEVEQVRQKEKPEKLIALTFPGLDEDIMHFVKTGQLLLENNGFLQAFSYLGKTTIGKKYSVQASRSRLFVSKQFSKTVAAGGRGGEDKGIMRRPVEWILWSSSTETALVVIPEEAELLLLQLRDPDEEPKTCLLSYATPVTRTMCHFSRLDYYVVPPMKRSTLQIPDWLSTEVGIVSGRLYFAWNEHEALISWLGMGSGPEDTTGKSACGLSTTETKKFLLDWLTHCHQLHNVLHTPMGFVCQGRELQLGHSFFVNPVLVEGQVLGIDNQNEHTRLNGHRTTSRAHGNHDEDDDSEDEIGWLDAEEDGKETDDDEDHSFSDDDSSFHSVGEKIVDDGY